jgi:hypothetical protein
MPFRDHLGAHQNLDLTRVEGPKGVLETGTTTDSVSVEDAYRNLRKIPLKMVRDLLGARSHGIKQSPRARGAGIRGLLLEAAVMATEIAASPMDDHGH